MRRSSNGSSSFTTTHWSLVECAGRAPTLQEKRAALSKLLTKYSPALTKFLIVSKRVYPDQAEDLVQGFIMDKILEQDLIAKAERRSGSKFRSFLKVTLWYYCVDNLPPTKNKIDVDRYCEMRESPATLEPGDLEWVQRVFEQTHLHMEEECRTSGRLHVWRLFEGRYLKPTLEEIDSPTYEQLKDRYGFETTGQIARFLADGRKIFERILRAILREYSLTDSDIDEEIAALIRISSAAPGGLAQILKEFDEE